MSDAPEKFGKCQLCERQLVRYRQVLGMQVQARSKYPVCLPCMIERSKDPEFQKWLAEKTNATTNSGNNAGTITPAK